MGRERTSNNHLISGAIIIVLLAVIFLLPSYGWGLRTFLSPEPSGSANAGGNGTSTDAQTLSAENDALKAQLAELQVVSSQLPTSSVGVVRAMVYSRYPMNFRNELLVSAGSDSGVTTGAAVVFQGMLIGQVRTVFKEESLVQTIFDDSLKMPVRIGSAGTNGLLQGGSYPIVTSVANTATVVPGDIVYSAAAGIPYALPIAQVVATSTSPDSLFQQTTLLFPYDINNVETVLIMK